MVIDLSWIVVRFAWVSVQKTTLMLKFWRQIQFNCCMIVDYFGGGNCVFTSSERGQWESNTGGFYLCVSFHQSDSTNACLLASCSIVHSLLDGYFQNCFFIQGIKCVLRTHQNLISAISLIHISNVDEFSSQYFLENNSNFDFINLQVAIGRFWPKFEPKKLYLLTKKIHGQSSSTHNSYARRSCILG